MSIKDYKVERIMIKEYNKFFRHFIRKRKLYDKIVKNSFYNSNNFNNSINRNDNNVNIDKYENIFRNITKILFISNIYLIIKQKQYIYLYNNIYI